MAQIHAIPKDHFVIVMLCVCRLEHFFSSLFPPHTKCGERPDGIVNTIHG